LDELISQPRFRASPLYNCVYDLCRAHALGDTTGDERAVEAEAAATAGEEEVLQGIVSLQPIFGTRLPMGFRPGSALLYHTSETHHRERHQEHGEEEGQEAEAGKK
jgi:hypothetical protein